MRNVHSELCHACLKGDLTTVVERLMEGANPCAPQEHGNTALHCAAHFGSVQQLKLLLDSVVDIPIAINGRGNLGKTPLHFACDSCHASAVGWLLANGADPELRDEDGNPPLHLAVVNQSDDIVCHLYDYGADLNATGWSGWTAVHFAVEKQNDVILESLLDKGASPLVGDERGDSPLHVAVEMGLFSTLEILLQFKASPSQFNSAGETPLHLAAVRGDADFMRILLDSMHEEGGKTNDGNNNNESHSSSIRTLTGATPLHFAAYGGKDEVISVLLESEDIDIDAKDEEGESPLFAACVAGYLETVVTLINAGADLDVTNNKGQSLLHIAVLSRHRDVVKLLIVQGLSTNDRDEQGLSPLHLAVDDEEILSVLLTIDDVNVNILDENDESPLLRACRVGESMCLQLLLNAKADPLQCRKDGKGALHCCTFAQSASLAQLLPGNLDPNEQDEDENTCVHLACSRGLVDMARGFCVRGAKCDIENKENETPLHIAARFIFSNLVDASNLVNLLIEFQADPNRPNNKAQTALMIASSLGNSFFIEAACAVKIVSKNAADEQKNTAMHLAVKNGFTDAVGKLLEGGADPYLQNMNAQTSLHVAAEYGRLKIIHLIASSPTFVPSLRDRFDQTPLMLASQNGHVEVVSLLLKLGAIISHQNKQGQTPLHLAALFGHVAVIHVLCMYDTSVPNSSSIMSVKSHRLKNESLNSNRNKNHCSSNNSKTNSNNNSNSSIQRIRDVHGNFPIHAAARGGKGECVKALVGWGAGVDWRGENEWTILHCAVLGGNSSTVDIVLTLFDDFEKEGGQNLLHARDVDGNTALHLASMGGEARILRILLRAGLQRKATNKQGETPLDLAKDSSIIAALNL